MQVAIHEALIAFTAFVPAASITATLQTKSNQRHKVADGWQVRYTFKDTDRERKRLVIELLLSALPEMKDI